MLPPLSALLQLKLFPSWPGQPIVVPIHTSALQHPLCLCVEPLVRTNIILSFDTYKSSTPLLSHTAITNTPHRAATIPELPKAPVLIGIVGQSMFVVSHRTTCAWTGRGKSGCSLCECCFHIGYLEWWPGVMHQLL